MKKILENTLKEFNELPGVKAKILEVEQGSLKRPRGATIDAFISIDIDGKVIDLPAEIKKELRTAQIPKIIEQAKQNPNLILLTDKYFPNLYRALTDAGVNYADETGRIHLKAKGIRVFKEGTRNVAVTSQGRSNTYTLPALKIIFHLLNKEWNTLGTYRELGDIGNTSLGNVNKIMNKLKDEGFIVSTKNEMKLSKKEKLFEVWVREYNQVMRPKLFVGNYRFSENVNIREWKKLKLKNGNVWGGEPAGAVLTDYLIPQMLTIYTSRDKMDLIKEFKLIPEPTNVQLSVFEIFWDQFMNRINQNKQVAPPMIVYTDLLNTNDGRNIETANIIYEKYIKEQLLRF